MKELSFETIGIIVVGLVLLSRWLWDYNRARREDAQEHEPRANPPLHATYATKSEHAELRERVDGVGAKAEQQHAEAIRRVDSVEAQLAANYQKLDENRSRSIANTHAQASAQITALRSEVKADIGALRSEIKQDNLAVQNRIGDMLTALGEVKGLVERNNA